ncbi:hypothetical protein TorRG33x02_262220 [Trema orientale]|uniref:Uncharacterized protein n=1 Tax=Trema orientale TaxID=63057 RepID=A0A2P5D4Y6_TREOI|nr:hypothetical protein TorRG33x02_262220 [Trema orientale]
MEGLAALKRWQRPPRLPTIPRRAVA